MRILCVCAYGQNRSRIAAEILSQEGYETRYGGIDPEAPNPLKKEDVEWAEAVVFARKRHQVEFHKKFKVFENEFVLEVTDNPDKLSSALALLRKRNPLKFYHEHTLPLIQAALDAKTFVNTPGFRQNGRNL